MPAYNSAETLSSAIGSVQAQTLTNWELIFVNDGSTDRTLEVAARIATADHRVRVINAPRGGRGVARNACISQVRGRFVAICDSDDVSHPDRFARQSAALSAAGGPDVISCSRVIAFSSAHKEPWILTGPETDREIKTSLDRGRMQVHFASAMLRADLFKGGDFDPELSRGQDFGFFLRIRDRATFAAVPDALLLYRTSAETVPWRHFRENNRFRRYARHRARGEERPFREFESDLASRTHDATVVPLQYLWFILRRRILRADIQRPTASELELFRALCDLYLGASAP